MRLFHTLGLASVLALPLMLAGCSTSSQYTSGADYLLGYQNYGVKGDGQTKSDASAIDAQVRDIASIEPSLRFPSRIGLARIEHGRLISIPSDEAQDWDQMRQDLGQDYGALVPVSPLIAAMVNDERHRGGTKALVDSIRRASARQHLDHVLIYEVNDVSDQKSNALRVTDLTVLGLFILPSRDVKVDTTATAMLIDVRNGYPYGTASAFASKDSLTSFAGSDSRKTELRELTRVKAVDALTDEVQIFMEELRQKSQNHAARN